MNQRILIVDDSPESLDLFRTMLSKALKSAEFICLDNATDALDYVQRERVDLVLLDAVMPGLSGFEACRTLKEQPLTRPIPVLMISGIMTDARHRVSGLDMGADGYLCKPFERDELVAQVKSLLRIKQYTDLQLQSEQRLEQELATRTASLRLSEERFRRLFDYSPDAIFVESMDGIVLDVNAAACRLHGRTKQSLVGCHVRELVPDGMQREVTEKFQKWATQELSTYEGFSLGPNGEAIPVEVRSSVIQFEGKEALLFHVRDVSERRRTDMELRQYREGLENMVAQRTRALAEANDALNTSRRNFHNIVEKSAEGILVVSAEGVIRYANPAAARLLGNTAGELVGSLYGHSLTAGVTAELSICLPGGGTGIGEAVVTPTEWLDLPANLVFLRDVSERERMEQQIRRAENLETVGLLAGGIAHDFNNLLAGILGNISYARSEETTRETLHEVLEEAERAAMRAKSLTQQLLTFAKGGVPVRKAASVSELLGEIVRFVLAGSKTAHRLSLAPDLWNAYMDPGQISEVIENIVINADQAMVRGGTIDVVADNYVCEGTNPEDPVALKPGRYVRIQICDQGVGMTPDVLKRVFDPYFTTKPKGSGLGLAVAYSVVMKHEGAIEVASRPGEGSTFTVYLPATHEAVVPEEDRTPTVRRGRGRVLVMDDEAFIRSLVVRMLKAIGYDAESVTNGDEAIQRYQACRAAGTPFDVVILDLTIPGGMGGVETMQELHKLDPAVKAIVSSGYSLEPVFSSYDAYGFKGGVAKPYDMKTLSGVLADVMASG